MGIGVQLGPLVILLPRCTQSKEFFHKSYRMRVCQVIATRYCDIYRVKAFRIDLYLKIFHIVVS